MKLSVLADKRNADVLPGWRRSSPRRRAIRTLPGAWRRAGLDHRPGSRRVGKGINVQIPQGAASRKTRTGGCDRFAFLLCSSAARRSPACAAPASGRAKIL